MTNIDYQALLSEITSGPLAAECAGQSDDAIASLLNDQRFTMVKERFVTARTILAEISDGAAILDALETASAAIPAVKWAMRYMIGETGIDVGYQSIRGQLDSLVDAAVLTEAQVEAIKAMAVYPASRGEIIGMGSITAGQVSRALRGPW